MNANAFHNLLNFVGLIVAALLTYDWTQLGLDATSAALVASWFLLADKVIKIVVNLLRDGIAGLFKVQPPVEK